MISAQVTSTPSRKTYQFLNNNHNKWRSGTTKAANGEAVVPIVVVGRTNIAGVAEDEVVGVAAVRVWCRRPVVAVVAGVVEQVAGILIDVAAPRVLSTAA